MNKQQVKGMGNRAAGEIKEQVGRATGNRSLEAKGHAQELKGKVQSGVGNVREEVKQDQRDLFTERELERKDLERKNRGL